MENILGVGGITISDLNDALISGDAPRNPDEGALWIDSSANTPVLKVYKNGSWQPQEIDVSNLDPELSETVTTIVNTLGTLADDGLLTYTDRLQLSVEIASIIGQIPSKQNGNVYPNTLPAYDTIDSRGVGSFSNLRQTARDATVPTDNEYYIALEQAYKALNTYLSSLTPRPWDVTKTNKDKNTEVANPDTYREALLNYYLAEMNLATYTEKRASDAAKEYTDASISDAITSVDVEYATSTDSKTVPEDDKWDTLAPTWSNGIFIWSRTLTTYKNGSTYITDPVNITGAKGESGGSGTPGRSITKIEEEYYHSDSATQLTGGTWSTTRPDWKDGKFIWTRSTITFANPSGSQTTDPISVTGAKGEKGDPGSNAPTIKLSGASQMIKQDASGNVTPSTSFNITGVSVNTTITRWLFSVNGGAFGTGLTTGVTRSGNVVTVNPKDVTFNTLSIRAEDGTVTDTFTIGRAVDGTKGDKGDTGSTGGKGSDGKDGIDAITVVLSNESHTFQAGTTNAIAGSTTTDIHAYKGTNKVAVTVGTITGMPPGDMTSSISNNGTVNARVTFTVKTSMTSPSGTVIINLTVDGKPIVKEFSYALTFKGDKGDKGDTGAKGATGSQGPRGAQGPQGIQGPTGNNGQSQYVHIRYSANSNGNPNQTNPSSTTKYIGVAVTSTSGAPGYASFNWSKYIGDDGGQGPQGPQGIRGPVGPNGQPTYTWVKYAEDKNGGGMSDSPEGKRFIGLAFNKLDQAESTTPSHYQWSEMPQNIEVGGRNLIFNSAELEASGLGSASGSRSEYRTINVGQSYMHLEDGAEVTLSFDLEMTVATANPSLMVYNTNRPGPVQITGKTISLNGTVGSIIKERVSVTTTVRINDPATYDYNTIEFYSIYSTDNFFRVSNLKLERGNIATDWIEAPEDTDKKITDGMEEVSTAVNAEWATEADSIRGDVEATYITANDFATLQTDVSTSFTQTEEAFDFRFNEAEKLVSGVEGNIETLENEIKKYIRFVDGSIILGAEGSTSEVIITNEKISFMQGGDSPIAFIEGQKMQINHGIFVDSATIAGFKFELVPGTDEVLGITWTD